MAGDWIKMRVDLADDPAVVFIARKLGIEDRDVIVGKLHALWSWATGHLADGNAVGVTQEFIDALVHVTGFAKAMADVRPNPWLIIRKSGVVFPRWEEHLSQGAKQRVLTQRRVANFRAQQSNADSVTKSLPEKRRVLIPPNPPPSGGNRRATRAERRADASAEEQAAAAAFKALRDWWLHLVIERRDEIRAALGWPDGLSLYEPQRIGTERLTAARRWADAQTKKRSAL